MARINVNVGGTQRQIDIKGYTDEQFAGMPQEQRDGIVDDVVSHFTENNEPTAYQRFFGNMAQATLGKAETFRQAGMPEYGQNLQDLGEWQAGKGNPALNPESELKVFGGDPLKTPNVSGYIAQQAGGLAGPLALFAAGQAAGGGPESPTGWIGGLALTFGDDVVTTFGNNAKQIAKTNGREQPNQEDFLKAAGVSGVAGFANAVGTALGFRVLGREGMSTGTRMLTSGGLNAGGAVTSDVINQLGTKNPQDFDPTQTANAAAGGLAAGPIGDAMHMPFRIPKMVKGFNDNWREANTYADDPTQSESDARVIKMLDGKRQTVEASHSGVKYPSNILFKGVMDDLNRNLKDLNDHLYDAGEIDDDGHATIKDVVSQAARHNRGIGEDGQKYNYFPAQIDRIRALGLRPEVEQTLVNSLRDLETATHNSLQKNRTGPFERAANHTSPIANAAIGFGAMGPVGLVAGLATRGLLRSGGRALDRFLGTQESPVVSRAAARAKMMEKRGINPGDTVKDLTGAIAAAKGRAQAVIPPKPVDPTDPVAQFRKDQGLERGGGWPTALIQHANEAVGSQKATMKDVVEAMKIAVENKLIKPEDADKALHTPGSRLSRKLHYTLQDLMIRNLGGAVAREDVPRFSTGTKSEPQAGPESGIRNEYAYRQTMQNVADATKAAHAAAPDAAMRSAVAAVANARTQEAKTKITDALAKSFPQYRDFIEGSVRPLTKFGPSEVPPVKAPGPKLTSGIDPEDIKKHLLDPAVDAVRKIIGYRIRDNQTKQHVSATYGADQGKRARTRAEKLNQDYGAHRYTADAIWDEPTQSSGPKLYSGIGPLGDKIASVVEKALGFEEKPKGSDPRGIPDPDKHHASDRATVAPQSSSKNNAVYKGKPFWSGAFDKLDGHIIATYPYEKAAAVDFHHHHYFGWRARDAITDRSAQFFWVDDKGDVRTEWRDGPAKPEVLAALKAQLKRPDGSSFSDPAPKASPIAEALTSETLASKVTTAPDGSHQIAKDAIDNKAALRSLLASPTGREIKAAPMQFPRFEGAPKVRTLRDAFTNAISQYRGMNDIDRAASSRAADETLRTVVGPLRLISQNAKALKASKGYKGGEPLKLADGRGVETVNLSLAPAYEEGGFKTCPNSAPCKDLCLGKTSGNYYQLGGGADLTKLIGPRLNSVLRTKGMLQHPEAFAVRLFDEVAEARDKARRTNSQLGVRLNTLSDINPQVHKALIEAFPDVVFYDYTKNNTDPIAPNHHYTYSSTGFSHDGIDNPHQNWKQMQKRLDGGDNVAMAFSHKAELPSEVFDEASGKTYVVVDGDTHDFRPVDIQPLGKAGVIIGLRNKAANLAQNDAAAKTHGFFVNYDPKYELTPKGTQVRDASGKPIARNKRVVVPPQGKSKPTLSNDDGDK